MKNEKEEMENKRQYNIPRGSSQDNILAYLRTTRFFKQILIGLVFILPLITLGGNILMFIINASLTATNSQVIAQGKTIENLNNRITKVEEQGSIPTKIIQEQFKTISDDLILIKQALYIKDE